MFNYEKTRINIIEYIKDLNIIMHKYKNVLPPLIAQNVFDIRVQSSAISRSSIETYVEKRDEYEREYKVKLELIESALVDMSYNEQRFFKDHFINGVKLELFQIQFRCGSAAVDHIKESSVIKFALALDLVVYK